MAVLRFLAAGNVDRCGIYVIPALGGAERRLGQIDLTDYRAAAGLLAWTPDGKWLAAAGRFGPGDPSEIWLLSPETGERRRLTVAQDGQVGDVGLSFSPDGRFLALLRFATRSVGDVYLLPLDARYAAGGPLVRLTHENLGVGGPCWISPGNRIVYSSGGALGYRTLRVLAIDPAHPERRVEPVPFPAGEQATMLASARNRLVYAREQRDTNIWRVHLPAAAATRGPTPLIASTFDDHNPDFSADGKRITFTSTRSGTEEGCASFLQGVDIACSRVRFGGKVLVIGVQLLLRLIDWQDRNSCVLFGDAAGAAVVAGCQGGGEILAVVSGTDGSQAGMIGMEVGGTRLPFTMERARQDLQRRVCLDGRGVFKEATRRMTQGAHAVLEKAGCRLDEVTLFVPHQANLRIIEAVAGKLHLPMDKVFVNIEEYGNTGAASIPLALHEARERRRLREGDLVLLTAFGAGLHWSAALIRY